MGAEYRNVVALLKIGVPFNTAWDMVDAGMWPEILAYTVAAGDAEGGKFDWAQMSFVKD